MSDATVVPGDSSIPLCLSICDLGAGGVTGQTPSLMIRNGATSNSYLDFNDNTFKTSGWTTPSVNLTEISAANHPGFYQYILNASLVAAMVDGFDAVIEYKNTGGNALIAQDVLHFRDKVSSSVTGSVGSVTGNVGGNVVGSVGSVSGNVSGNVVGSIGSLAAQAKADVNAEADTALADVGVTTTVTGRIDASISSRVAASFFSGMTSILNWMRAIMRKGNIDPTTISEINSTTGSGTGTYDPTTDALEAIRDNLASAGPTASQIADAVWDEDLSGHPTTGSAGKALSDAASGSGGGVGQGDGSIEVDHDTGGTDNLRYTTSGGAGIDNATVRAYLKSDWDALRRSDTFVVARVTTNVDGRWGLPMFLDPETYTFVFNKQGQFGPADTKDQVVS